MRISRHETAALLLTAVGLALMFLLTRQVESLWHRLALFYVFMLPLALVFVRLEWRALFRFRARHVWIGLVAAALLYAVGWIGAALLRQVPAFAAEIERMYAMLDAPGWQVALLLWIIAGEEIVWRQAATQPFVKRLGYGAVVIGALAFMLVHVPWAPPVLWIAALVFGGAWSWMAVRWKSFWPPFVAHVVWDVLIFGGFWIFDFGF
jgi:membrane protease YdiL (CAAX protease family)